MKIISSEKMTLLSNLLHNDEMAKLTSQLCNRYPHVQPQRIEPYNRIRRILKQIHSAPQTNRILTHKPPDFRVVIAETVVVQPAFFVVILSLEAERDVGFEVV